MHSREWIVNLPLNATSWTITLESFKEEGSGVDSGFSFGGGGGGGGGGVTRENLRPRDFSGLVYGVFI